MLVSQLARDRVFPAQPHAHAAGLEFACRHDESGQAVRVSVGAVEEGVGEQRHRFGQCGQGDGPISTFGHQGDHLVDRALLIGE